MKYSVVLFDLDGTLIDTGRGITNSVMYSLKKFGIDVQDRKSLYKFVGPPLHKSYENFYGFSKEKSMLAVEYYREYYRDKGVFEVELYDGIVELLKALKNNGLNIAVATSKPKIFAVKVLKYVGIYDYFDVVIGAELDGSRTDKSEVISCAIEYYNAYDKSQMVMVGDREFDIIGANAHSMDSIGVTYGFGSKEELQKSGALYIADTPKDIEKALLD